jgi:GH15 family glucan-1,4-alpha-glucosidase
MLGNGSLTVGLNELGLVHDFYYPYVGLDNLTTARSEYHKIGIWADGRFSWVDDSSWNTKVDFEEDALVANCEFSNDDFGLTLKTDDFVDHDFNAFCRQITVKNTTDRPRSVRLFFHQVFQISRGGRADTALYDPTGHYILDYKGRCSLLVYSQKDNGEPMTQYSVGNCGIEGKEGTWRDAEDGELSNNPVEHGGVDSVVSNHIELEPGAEQIIQYWIIAADSQYSAEAMHKQILEDSFASRLQKTKEHWGEWLATSNEATATMSPTERKAIRKSLMVIKAHTDRRGGIIASCDSSIYNYGRDYYSYVWPRDGAYVMWPLIRLGYTKEPKKFFGFCRDIMHPDGYMMHKYQPDKAIGSTWHPLVHGRHSELAIQEDETAIIVFMLSEFYAETKETDYVQSMYTTMIQPMANFMAKFRDESTGLPHASYDLWEEKFLTHTYTTALVHRALTEAAKFAEEFEYPDDAVRWNMAADEIAKATDVFFDPERQLLRKGFLLQDDGSLQFDNTLDVSTGYGAMMYAAKTMGISQIRSTFEGIERILLNSAPVGGSPRYEHDNYFMSEPPFQGNPWFVTTLWIAQYYMQIKREDDAARLVEWTLEHTSPSGILAEQINPTDGSPISVMPLVWSHAELINTLLDLRG